MLTLSLDDPRWADLLASARGATPFHHPSWAKLLSETYGYPAYGIAVAGPHALAAGIPVLEVGRALLARKRVVSLPFTDVCPPLVRDGGLAELSAELASARGDIPPLEIRADVPVEGAVHASEAVIHRLTLERDPDLVFARFRKSHQRGIARASREGVSVRRASSSRDATAVFYDLHLHTRSRLGVPIQPRRYFRLLWERIIEPELGFLLLAISRGQPVAGAVFLAWKETVIYKYGASDTASLGLRPNHALFWSAIRWAAESGFRTFDLGRTDGWNDGLRSFKSGWGAVEDDLVYSYLGDRPTHGATAGRLLQPVIRRSPPWVCRAVGELFYRYAA